ncbi:MAG: GGDEF domain-containing protein [Desulfitobacteriaceae bacterium]
MIFIGIGIGIGIGIALLLWIFDSMLCTFVFHEGTFNQNLFFSPGFHMHVLWHRLIIISLFILTSCCTYLIFKRQKQTELKFRLSEQRANSVFEYSDIGMSMIDLDAKSLCVNRKYCEILGYSEAETLNMSYQETTYQEDLEMEMPLMNSVISGQTDSYHIEKRSYHKEGHIVWIYVTMSLVRDKFGNPSYLVAQIQDITVRKTAEKELRVAKEQAEKARDMAEHLAHTDYLTGLLNRRSFMKRLEEEFQRSIRQDQNFGLILTDIDKFKLVNDIYGHQVGDAALQEFADCLRKQSREYDFIGRYGGEEFVICLPDTNREQATAIAERMRCAVEEIQILLQPDQVSIKITASFGVVTLQRDFDNLDSLISRADQLMYKAKAKAGNNVYVDLI